MGIVPAPFGVIRSFFRKEISISMLPGIQHTVKAFLGYIAKIVDNAFEINGSLHPRIFGEFACYDRMHMEVTHLNRDIMKKFHDTGLSIQNNRLKNKASAFQLFPKCFIDLLRLSVNKVISDWLFVHSIFGNKQPQFILPFPKPGDIHDNNDLSRFPTKNPRRILVKMLLDPLA